MFLSVRFVLIGFDPILEAKVRSKLVNGGGIDVGEYGPSCTHVIVDKIAYDDPVCVAARTDGKTLVTGLWVDHSVDIGMPVDAGLILYRPVKDFNGIPGAEALFVCLTGYQRQDREDIMKMVGLMGANFSKPLVANKVTHLICYKFEGEKYELAKKMKKIKLVNHRWLEDCLREWKILPEGNYSKSGYELEMEAEAKDSEEETEEAHNTKQIEERSFNMQSGTPRGSKLTMPTGEVSRIHQDTVSPKCLSNVAEDIITNDRLLTTPRKDTRSSEVSCSHDVSGKGPEEFGYRDTGTSHGDAVSGGMSIPFDKTLNLNKECSESTSNFGTAKRSSHSDEAKLITLSYCRKTPRKSPVSVFSEHLSHSRGSPQSHLEENKVKEGLDNSMLTLDKAKENIDLGGIQIQRTGRELYQEEGHTGILPQKRKADVSCTSSGSPKKGSHNSKACASGSPASTRLEELEPALMIGVPLMKTSPSLSNDKHPLEAIATVNSVDNKPTNPSTTNSLSFNKKSFRCGQPVLKTMTLDSTECPSEVKLAGFPKEKTPESSLGIIKGSTLAGEPDVGDVGTSRTADLLVGKRGEPQKQHQDGEVSSSNTNDLEIEKSGSLANVGTHRGENDEAFSRPLTKKMVGRKSLGSRPKLNTGKASRHKGSFNFDKTLIPNAAAVCSVEVIVGAEKEKKVDIENLEIADPTFAADVVMEEEVKCNNVDNMPLSLDDETEAPDEVEKAVSEEKPELVEPNLNADIVMEEKSKLQQSKNRTKTPITCMDDDTVVAGEGKNGAELEKAFNGNNTEMGESIFKADAVREDIDLGGKHRLKKTKKKAVSSVNKIKTSEKGKDKEELGEGNGVEKSICDTKTEMGESTFKADAVKKDIAKGGKHPLRKTKINAAFSMNETETSEKGKDREEVGVGKDGAELKKAISDEKTEMEEKTFKVDAVREDITKEIKHPSSKTKKKAVSVVDEIETSKKGKGREKLENNVSDEKTALPKAKGVPCPASKTKSKTVTVNKTKKSMDAEKENKPIENGGQSVNLCKRGRANEAPIKNNEMVCGTDLNVTKAGGGSNFLSTEPAWFILSGHHLQRKEFQQVIRRLRGRFCRDSHHWSYQATHFIVPDPVRRTEKFFAAAASGRWILKTDYLTASHQAGKFLAEEPYEWFRNGLSEDGAINLEAPRKWRLLRERTGHGAFYGMRIIIYGECIAPPLDALKRVVKAGDGTILATSPPYTRFLNSGVDFAIVSPGMPRVDSWVQEFLSHSIPCVLADYLVEYVCKPAYSLEKHVLYNTHTWAEKSFTNLLSRSEEIVEPSTPPKYDGNDDLPCQVCGSRDRGEVMMICGDESGSVGCGVGIHIDCCDPPLEAVPEDDWFCSKCSKSKNSSNPRKNTKLFRRKCK